MSVVLFPGAKPKEPIKPGLDGDPLAEMSTDAFLLGTSLQMLVISLQHIKAANSAFGREIAERAIADVFGEKS